MNRAGLVAVAPTGLSIERVAGAASKWEPCIKSHAASTTGSADAKRAHAQTECAKLFPGEHAWFHALHEESDRIVSGAKDVAQCPTGYLCGTGCTPIGETCCIDVGHPDRVCPTGNICVAPDKCIDPTPHPAAASGGGGCQCGDGSWGCCGRGCCSHHGGVR